MPSFKNIMNRLCLDKIKNKKQNIIPDITEYIVDKKLIDYECLICLEEFNEGETISLIKCGHMYHTQCIYSWFLTSKTCPLCDEELIID
tara:strand:+ start:260 stop:526 length:267 start_codon:yes stop_codon:yes gene_type:complete